MFWIAVLACFFGFSFWFLLDCIMLGRKGPVQALANFRWNVR